MPLSPTEVRLLDYLIAHAGEELSFRRLLQEVWGYSDRVESRTVYTTVGRLRQKIERDPSEPRHILAIPGVGYRFEAPVPASASSGVIGRERELAALRALLGRRRIVALVGPGGVGKTTLARELGPEAVFVALDGARDATDLRVAVAGALGLLGSGLPEVDRVGRALSARGSVLVVLDEVEGIADQLDAVQTWQDLASEARFLLTSRVPPQFEGVALHPLQPLDPPPTELPEGPAVELFLQRARAVRPGFQVERPDDLVALVRRLDGLPLALELAAARMSVLSPGELLARIEHNLGLLRRRGESGKHSSLDAVLASTFALLDPFERSALSQATVFVGGFGVEAAEAVLELGPGAPLVLDVLDELVARALVRVVETEPTRFLLLETVRAFAAERLEDPDAVRRRHARWCATHGTEEHVIALRGPRGAELARKTRRERENLLAGAEFALGAGDPELAGGAVRAATVVLDLTGPATLSAALAERALRQDVSPRIRALLLLTLGVERSMLGDYEEALRSLDEAARITSDERVLGLALTARGLALCYLGQLDAAVESHRRAVELHRRTRPQDLAKALVQLGRMLTRLPDRDAEARACLEKAVHVARVAGYRSAEAVARGHLARLAADQGLASESWMHARASVELLRGEERDADLLFALGSLARASLTSAPSEARATIQEARDLARRLGNLEQEACSLHYEQVLCLNEKDRASAMVAGDRAIVLLSGSRLHGLEPEFRLFNALTLLLEGHGLEARREAALVLAHAREREAAPLADAVHAWALVRTSPGEDRARAIETLSALRSEDSTEEGMIRAIGGHASLDVGDISEARRVLDVLRRDPADVAIRAHVRFLVDALAERLEARPR